MEIKDNAVSLDMSVKQLRPSTRAYSFDDEKLPYTIDRSKNLYSLCKWGEGGNLTYIFDNSTFYSINKDYITSVNQIGDENISDVTKRLKKFFNPYNTNVDNSRLLHWYPARSGSYQYHKLLFLHFVFLRQILNNIVPY